MDVGDLLFAGLSLAMREAALFAALGFLMLGASDLLVDLIWIGRTIRCRFAIPARSGPANIAMLPAARPGRLAIFVPAWDEAGVIAEMLRHALACFDHDDYRLYVGCYVNDPATIAAVRGVEDRRVRLVVGAVAGPTTKAECLNRLWDAMLADEAAGIM